jgi:hypothetical protein
MIWQDLLISIGSICFSIALLPMLKRGADRPPVFTAGLTAFWLYAYFAAFSTLGLWYAAITGAINAVLWTAIGILKWNDKARPKRNAKKLVEEWRAEDPEFWHQVDVERVR